MAATQDQDRRRETPTGMGISDANKVRSVTLTDWEAVRDSLPHPDDVWRWGETDMAHKTLYAYKEAGLIVPAKTEKYWRTSRQLWKYVQETALPGEDVGAVVRWDPTGRTVA